jgi:predicted dinucleotide-binding enzyme
VSTSTDMAHTRTAAKLDSSIRRIGVIGLGHMGSTFADNLIADGYEVAVAPAQIPIINPAAITNDEKFKTAQREAAVRGSAYPRGG